MSRSYKHTPIIGIAGNSEKQDKRIANRRQRTLVRCILHGDLRRNNDGDSSLLPLIREVSNVYSFSKDGRRWMNIQNRSDLRK